MCASSGSEGSATGVGEVHDRPQPTNPQPQSVNTTQPAQFNSGLSVDAIVDALLRRLQEAGVTGGGAKQPEHQHRLVFREDSAFCVDCDTRFSRVKNFNDKLRLLGEPHEGKPFLECPSCRPLFVKSLRDMGYDVSDLGDRLIIKSRRRK